MHSPHDYDKIALPLIDSALRQSACKTYLVQRELCVCCRCVACRTCVTVCRSWRPNCVVTWTMLFPPRVGGCPSSFVSAFSACPCSLSISLSLPLPLSLLPRSLSLCISLSLSPSPHSLSTHPLSPLSVFLSLSLSTFLFHLSPPPLSLSFTVLHYLPFVCLSVVSLFFLFVSFHLFLCILFSVSLLSKLSPPPPPSLHHPLSFVSPFLSPFHLPLIPLHLPFVCPPPPPPMLLPNLLPCAPIE